MSDPQPTVFIVDDDDAVRDALCLLMRSLHLNAQAYSSAAEFLEAYDARRPGCLVLDVRMPGMSGLELQSRLAGMGSELPIIFLTGHGDVPMAVEAMQLGAEEFLQKPFRDQDLIDRIQRAMERDAQRRRAGDERRSLQERIDQLTAREREVLQLMVEGKATKVMAVDLGLSPRTVEIHRARVMEKMQARSVADLVRMVLLAEPPGGD